MEHKAGSWTSVRQDVHDESGIGAFMGAVTWGAVTRGVPLVLGLVLLLVVLRVLGVTLVWTFGL